MRDNMQCHGLELACLQLSAHIPLSTRCSWLLVPLALSPAPVPCVAPSVASLLSRLVPLLASSLSAHRCGLNRLTSYLSRGFIPSFMILGHGVCTETSSALCPVFKLSGRSNSSSAVCVEIPTYDKVLTMRVPAHNRRTIPRQTRGIGQSIENASW